MRRAGELFLIFAAHIRLTKTSEEIGAERRRMPLFMKGFGKLCHVSVLWY